MMWVLIFIVSMDKGGASVSQEFLSEKACYSAATSLKKAYFDQSFYYSKYAFVCVPKDVK